MYEANCHECGRDFKLKREPRNPRAWRKCPRCRRAITRVTREVNRKQRERQEYAAWKQKIYNRRSRAEWIHTGDGWICVDAIAGGRYSDGLVWRATNLAGFWFRTQAGTIDDDELYLAKYIEGWRKLIRKYTPRGTRKIS